MNVVNEKLMDRVLDEANLNHACKAVKANAGGPGIDHMSVEELADHVRQHWSKIEVKLREGTYKPAPVRPVKIPKPNGGTRELGVPTVLDRLIQQALYQVLSGIFEPRFSEHSYGFRPGRSTQDAMNAAQKTVQEGKDWIVDIDIAAFFDNVNHDRLMTRIGQVIRDKTVLRLIGRYLRAGKLEDGKLIRTGKGTPQGGPLSPLLANIYLHDLDIELEKRGLSFVRYADDCNIYVGSERAAQCVIDSVSRWIEKNLKLQVNADKSGTGRPWERKFLGFQITEKGKIRVAPESLERLKERVRNTFCARRNLTSNQLRDEWKERITGWWSYFRLAEWRYDIFDLEGWIRRHIRKCFWLRWHNKKGRLNALKRLGITGKSLKVAGSSRGAWRIARSHVMHHALNNKRLRKTGFLMPSDLAG